MINLIGWTEQSTFFDTSSSEKDSETLRWMVSPPFEADCFRKNSIGSFFKVQHDSQRCSRSEGDYNVQQLLYKVIQHQSYLENLMSLKEASLDQSSFC